MRIEKGFGKIGKRQQAGGSRQEGNGERDENGPLPSSLLPAASCLLPILEMRRLLLFSGVLAIHLYPKNR